MSTQDDAAELRNRRIAVLTERILGTGQGSRARKPRAKEAPHIGMDGKPCQCAGPSARYRARKRGGCAATCWCHDVKHAKCPNAKPCLGGCGRLTTAGESPACGYCLHCNCDTRWRTVTD